MKNLLIATDLSARSDRAVECAVSLARQHNARLTIVHVIDEEMPSSMAQVHQNAANESIQAHIDTLLDGDDSHVTVKIVVGRPYRDILEVSEDFEADLIVLGLHRKDAFKDMFRGTTAERVIRAGKFPVLLVSDRPSGAYRRIMVGVDFSIYSRRAVEFAVRFAPDGQFELVHAYDVPFKGFLYSPETQKEVIKQHEIQFKKMIDEEMATFLSSLKPNAPKLERVMQEGTVRDVIHGQVERIKPDLLVIGTHGRTGVAHAFLGSVAEDLLRNPPCDVLAVPAWK